MNRRDWMIAAPVLAALAGCMAAFLHGVQIEAAIDGIAALRALDTPRGGRVVVVAAQALHVLDADGKRLARQALHTLGLQDEPNDMDLTLDSQGQLEAWFVEDADPQPRVLHCVWNDAQRRMAPCVVAAQGPQLKWDARSRAVHLAVDRPGQRMFIADAKSHRVQVFDLAGRRIAHSEAATLPLYYPNRLRYLGNDQLAIADNDHRRLVWAAVRPGAAPRLLGALYASDHPQARSGRSKVTDAAFGTAGTIWMLAVKQGQKNGDVLVFDAGHKPVARAELPEGADPLIVEALGETAIVADYTRIQLYRIDAAGRNLGEFGDAALRAELEPMRALSARVPLWTTGSLIVGGVVIVAGLVLAWRFGERPVPAVRQAVLIASKTDVGPLLQFPVVLDTTQEYRVFMRKQMWVLGAVAILVLGAALVVVSSEIRGARGAGLLVGGAAALVVNLTTAWYFMREVLVSEQLRVTDSRVGLFRKGRCVAEAPLNEVFASGNALLLGRHTVIYRWMQAKGKRPAKYDLDLLTRSVLQRIPVDHLIDAMALNRKQWKRIPMWQRAIGIGSLLVVVAWLLKDQLPIQ